MKKKCECISRLYLDPWQAFLDIINDKFCLELHRKNVKRWNHKNDRVELYERSEEASKVYPLINNHFFSAYHRNKQIPSAAPISNYFIFLQNFKMYLSASQDWLP